MSATHNMWTITRSLLLTCCLQAALALAQGRDDDEPGGRRSVWEDVIEFQTKGTKDECYMSVARQGDPTKLRITCQGHERSYWCEYHGMPDVCRSYVKNPTHYYRQIMWDLRKLPNACQGGRFLKPHMCKRASDTAQMVFKSASSAYATPMDRPYRPAPITKQRPKPTRTQPNPPNTHKSTTQRRIITPTPTVPQPTTQAPMSEAKKLAQDYCWRSFNGVCSWVIGWFRN